MIELRVTEWMFLPRWGHGAIIDPQALPPPQSERKNGYDVIPGLIPGQRVKLDDEEHTIKGIERFAVSHWWALRFAILIEGER